MMTEYIEREASLNFRLNVRLRPEELTAAQAVAEAIMEHIKAIPAADVAPVVRCADCKWFQINIRKDGYLPNGVPECECRHWCGPCDPTDFCSYGARMDLVTACNQVKDGDGE